MFNDTKSIFASKGVWGSLAAIAGVAVPPLLKATGHADIAAEDVISTGSALVAAIGGVLALIGRLTAKHQLT